MLVHFAAHGTKPKERNDTKKNFEVNVLNSARRDAGGCGTETSALCMGNAGDTAITESWNGTNWTEVNLSLIHI